MTHRCTVIGAGAVGAAVALHLQRDGHEVVLLERDRPAAGASFGNSGAIVNGSCAPTAMPGVWKEALRAIVDPLAPFSLRPGYLPKALPWLLRFLSASRRSRLVGLSNSLYSLSRHATTEWLALAANTSIAEYLDESHWLKIYETERGFADTADARALLDANEAPYTLLSAGDIRELEPSLAPIYAAGILQPNGLRITSPGRLVETMVDSFVAAGGRFEKASVNALTPNGDQVEISTDGPTCRVDRAVVALGAWSRPLAASLGDDVPLDAERGYHMMLPAGSEALLSRPVVNAERFFVLSPMLGGMRMTSQSELAGVDAPPDYRRIRRLLPEAKRMLPDLEVGEPSVWMGGRPSLPDSLPVIGSSTRSPNILYAFGHQHLGMTLAAITGRLVAELAGGREPAVDLSPFRPDRF